MKIAYFDTIAGVSGDMTLAAFIGAGIPLGDISREVGRLGLPGVELKASTVVRNGISAVRLEVLVDAPEKKHRHLKDILAMIAASSLPPAVRRDAERIFTEVGKAEARVHGTTIDRVHFHEVGAIDSIVDIVGAAVCVHLAGIEKVYSSPVRLGRGGFADTEHGKLPVPGPAAVEILKGYPTVLTDVPFELTTPTGAAIIRALSSGVMTDESVTVGSVGYGAGTREIPGVPNLLRIMIGTVPDGGAGRMLLVEANIDDMNPEIAPFVVERLMEAGAADAWTAPVIMKKGRPGIILSALAPAERLDAVTGIFLSQTTTIGVRVTEVSRRVLPRQERTIRTSLGPVRVKVIVSDGIERVVPEFEECRRVALERKIPLHEVYRRIEREAEGHSTD